MNRTDAGRTSAGRDGVVLATRTPDRAHALAEALRQRRLRLILSPLRAPRALTEPELDALDAALGGGPWEAATFTSVNGLRGLRAGLARLHAAGRSVHAEPAALLAGARVHCVGRATAEEARAQGLTPAAETAAGEEEQSARGLLTRLGRTGAPGSVLCVHGRPHRPELADGLRELGAEVTEAVAYAMADWPAPEPLGGQAPGGAGEERPAESAAPALDRQATAAALRKRAADVVLVTSPRQLEALHFLGPLPEPVVCLGSTTAARARELGLAAVTAVSPAPEDLAEAALRARSG
ncbi:uroporphyrinogen-III synthase [Rothia kristinae]|uniref:uroporphyrinogen-III synthase n=1 Tax=Rothia kristinae TaxID=37923 RepID=UPI0022DF99F3|nr:uroporphyrinogen-III synthase [Rothia kristinae]